MKYKGLIVYITAIIFALAFLYVLYLNAQSNRYMLLDDELVMDKWTGTVYYQDKVAYVIIE